MIRARSNCPVDPSANSVAAILIPAVLEPGSRRSLVPIVLLLALSLLTADCRRRPAAPTPAPAPVVGATQVGIASWYGPPFHGRKTANGETYDMNGPTAAHKTLPFGAYVKVNNLENKKSTVVRINDRGPFVKDRIIDLSRKAAADIDMIRNGTARVRLEVVKTPTYSPPRGYTVQVGAFRKEKNARRLQKRLAEKYEQVSIEPVTHSAQTLYRVRVGQLPSLDRAEQLAARLRHEQDVPEAMIVPLD